MMKSRNILIFSVLAATAVCLSLLLFKAFYARPFSVDSSMQEELDSRIGTARGGYSLYEAEPVVPCGDNAHTEKLIAEENGHYSLCTVCKQKLSELVPHEAVMTYASGYVIVDGKIYVSVSKLCVCGEVYSCESEPMVIDERK